MKILINATCIATARATGIERFALHIARELCQIDPSVTVVASEPLTGIPDVVIPKELAVSRSLLGRREFLFRAAWDQTVFRSTVARHNPDLIFFPIQDGMLAPPAKQVVTVHDLHYLHFRQMGDCSNEIGELRRRVFSSKMPKIFEASAAIVAVSQSTGTDLVQHFGLRPDQVTVVHNGYDEERFRVIHEVQAVLSRLGLQDKAYLLFVGSILRHKNIERVVEAVAKANTGLALVVVGANKDDAYLRAVQARARECGLDDSIFRYLEYVSDQDLPVLYRGALSFVLPSLHEGFGVPILEAMACGTPVVTSNCSAMPEVAGDAAVYCDPLSVDSIADAVRAVVWNQELRNALTTRGFERAYMFRWRRSAQRLYRLFEEVVHS
ncbi:glycosyltransferase family 1 protein [Geobacter sp. SVR]|uniref:glycosyltransferase family 4 protein n=1 Tax=Geobacter sp. SVR TaxID=2495594 RepID=UPI00143EFAD1|nr:glycosyltransferase family 1 protein [Geobacter sp. SVR]BCS53767.1 glycosyl transferase [Geobacter sp. SVR]GCF85724.1 glycosyl transferase [Geobacter sp. SVR]